MIKSFTNDAWDEYCAWESRDKKTLKRINLLIKDIERNGAMTGIRRPRCAEGKPAG